MLEPVVEEDVVDEVEDVDVEVVVVEPVPVVPVVAPADVEVVLEDELVPLPLELLPPTLAVQPASAIERARASRFIAR